MVDLPTFRLIRSVAEIDPTRLDTWATAGLIALVLVAAVRLAGPLLERAQLRLHAAREGWAEPEAPAEPADDLAAAASAGLLAGTLPGLLLWVDRQAVVLHLGEELIGRLAWLTPAGWIILGSVALLLAALAGLAVRQLRGHGLVAGLVGTAACAAVGGAAMALGVIAGPAVAFWLAVRPGARFRQVARAIAEPVLEPAGMLYATFRNRFG